MWRRVDLHNHTFPNERCDDQWDADRFVSSAVSAGVEVLALTDHDACTRYADVVGAAADDLAVLPGVEISTDRGHVLVISVGAEGDSVIQEFCGRLGVKPGGQIDLTDLLALLPKEASTGHSFRSHVITIGAHVDLEGHLLGPRSSLSLERQLELVRQLDAVEVARDEVFDDWTHGGVKQHDHLVMLRGSDTHDPAVRRVVDTYLYLTEVSVPSIKHALAIPEASVAFGLPPVPAPHVSESFEISGGLHGPQRLQFVDRANAIIGPPNAGKSLLIDCLKFVFDLECQIGEVESVTKRRIAACLPRGTIVSVAVRSNGQRSTVTRTIGGSDVPTPPFKPVVFSQTELVRRSHELVPSVHLLDVHCAEVVDLQARLRDGASKVGPLLSALIRKAAQAKSLTSILSNTEDGLAATKATLTALSGTEPVALRAGGIAKAESWRDASRSRLDDWLTGPASGGPTLPSVPTELDPEHEEFIPSEELQQLIDDYRIAAEEGRKRLVGDALSLLDDQEDRFAEAQEKVDEELATAGCDEGTEVMTQLRDLRTRLTELESKDTQAGAIGDEIDQGLVELKALVETAAALRAEITTERRAAASSVNDSMRSFFAVVEPNGDAAKVDELIDTLKRGTYLREPDLLKTRDDLNRVELLEFAVRLAQGRVGAAESRYSEQQKIAANAVERGLLEDLAKLATTYPADSLDLRRKMPMGTAPVPFRDLTEGLRALAIKEVSFAASDLPVITDQPEDAVPTRSVYESLVPTMRTQRATRQFIVISHDANIVVGSDVEHVNAVRCGASGETVSGNLFSREIRDLALEHLEGGLEAFERRSSHYSRA